MEHPTFMSSFPGQNQLQDQHQSAQSLQDYQISRIQQVQQQQFQQQQLLQLQQQQQQLLHHQHQQQQHHQQSQPQLLHYPNIPLSHAHAIPRPHPLSQHHPPIIPPRSTSSAYIAHQGLTGELDRKSSHDSKPRLSKEQHDLLESHFKHQPKPSTQTKKSFADTLDVPLDKINNWFQNRRAKVKQEHKKRQQAYQLYLNPAAMVTSAGMDPPPAENAWIDPSFYQTHEPMPRHSMMVPSRLPVVAEVSDSPMGNGPAIYDPESGQNVHLTPHGAEPLYNDGLFNQFFGLPGFTPLNPSVEMNSDLTAYGKQFNPQGDFSEPLLPPNVDFDGGYGSSGTSSMLTRDSADDSSVQMSALSDDGPYCWESFTSAGTNGRPSMADSRSDCEPNYTYSRNSSFSQHLPRRPAVQQTIPDDIPNFDAIHPANTMSRPLRTSQSVQTLPTRSSNLGREVSSQAEEQDRPNTAIKQEGPPDLASRRRQRPVALNTLRTTSFNSSNSAASPQVANPSMPEHHLRRIKSSTGVLSGRIQKNNVAQRSPAHLTFAEASAGSLPRGFRRESISGTQGTNQKVDVKRSTGALTPASEEDKTLISPQMLKKSSDQAQQQDDESLWSWTDLDGADLSSHVEATTEDSVDSPPSTPRVSAYQSRESGDIEMSHDDLNTPSRWRQPFETIIEDMPALLAQDLSDQAHLFPASLSPDLGMDSDQSRRTSISSGPPRAMMAMNPITPVPGQLQNMTPARLRHSVSQQQVRFTPMSEGMANLHMGKSMSDLRAQGMDPDFYQQCLAGNGRLPFNHASSTFSSP